MKSNDQFAIIGWLTGILAVAYPALNYSDQILINLLGVSWLAITTKMAWPALCRVWRLFYGPSSKDGFSD